LTCRHWGQTLRGGGDSRQALARRLRLLLFEVFFFGTAMAEQILSRGGIDRRRAAPEGSL
jgi:hypothetical protein